MWWRLYFEHYCSKCTNIQDTDIYIADFGSQTPVLLQQENQTRQD